MSPGLTELAPEPVGDALEVLRVGVGDGEEGATGIDGEFVEAGAAGDWAGLAISPSCAPAPADGAATGAFAAPWFGVYTGGSSSIVYSRTRCPRAVSTSTNRVTNGSVIESVDFSLMTSRPSAVRCVRTWTLLRKTGQSSP